MRILDFTDGFTSASAPTIGFVPAAGFQVYANDAAFVTAKGAVASTGDAYYNSTFLHIRAYNGTRWIAYVGQRAANTFAAPSAITAAGGVTAGTTENEVQYMVGSPGAVTVTATPQISAPGFDGQILTLFGTDDTKSVTLNHGTGLVQNGPCTLKSDRSITYRGDATTGVWRETGRN